MNPDLDADALDALERALRRAVLDELVTEGRELHALLTAPAEALEPVVWQTDTDTPTPMSSVSPERGAVLARFDAWRVKKAAFKAEIGAEDG